MTKFTPTRIIKKLHKLSDHMINCGILLSEDIPCCISCGISESISWASELNECDCELINGCLFYTSQDVSSFGGLGYLNVYFHPTTESEYSARQIGIAICNILECNNFEFEWDACENCPIRIYA